MKQTCIARNTEDVASLLGQCERIMGVMRSNPDADHLYTNTHMETVTGLDVLSSPTDVEIHAGNSAPYTISITPDASRSIDEIVTSAMKTPAKSADSSGTLLRPKS
ncbi:MAG: hypothetical protein ACXW30_06945 [Micavibrio sp.]